MCRRLIWLQVIVFVLTACMPAATNDPIFTATPTPPTPTLTPTIIWFPPTPTYTPYPTITSIPLPDQRPGIGELIITDDFTDPEVWMLSTSLKGSVAMGKGEITIVIKEERGYLFSLRQEPILDDFYAEITANPTLCRELDEYGLLLRISEELDYYRFSLSCNGQVRLDRIYKGQASALQTWLLSGAVPPGAPSISRLGAWVSGNEMRVFVNDEYQFGVNDPLIANGKLGVFARSASDMAVTVNYSDLMVWEVIP